MKSNVLLLFLFICLSTKAQTTTDIIVKLKDIRQEKGDSIARDYLIANESVFQEENANETYLAFWGLLTSNMWNNNPSEPLKNEYKKYLKTIFEDDNVKSEEFIPEEQSLSFFWEIAFDYYNILFVEGDKESALAILLNLHRWFKPYSEAKKTIGYAQSLNDLCLLLVRDMHKYSEGEPFAKEYVDVAKTVYGEKSAQYAVAIYNMNFFPNKTVSERRELIKEAISIYEEANNHSPLMLKEMKELYEAQLTSLTGVTNIKNIKSKGDRLSLTDCEALIASERGSEALETLLFYKEQFSNEHFLDTLKYGNVISNIIVVYQQMNDLEAAQKELDSFNSKIGIDNLPPMYSLNFYNSAAQIAYCLKDYPKALAIAHAVCKLSELYSSDIEYCKILANVATIYSEAAQYVDRQFYLDAKWFIDEAVSIFEERIGPLVEHGATGLTLLNNKALIYANIGDLGRSIETYERIVSDFEGNEDVEGPWSLAANNLASLYTKTNQSEKAARLLENLSSKNKEYNKMFKQNLAISYYAIGDRKLRKALKEYNDICYNNCMDVFTFFTPAEREAFWTNNARELLVVNNLVADKYPDIADVAFDNLLFVKNLKLMSSDILKKMVDDSSNNELKENYKKVSYLRDAILYRSNEQDSIKIWDSMLNDEERSILSMIPNYKENLLKSFHSWEDIKEALNDDEIAIDFTYVLKIKDWDNGIGYYGAFIVTNKSQKPTFVTLCEVDEMNRYIIGTSSDVQQISSLYKDSVAIYEKLWGKLENHIRGKKTIYFSPTGSLNLLNHDALTMPNGEYFGDLYNLVLLSSTDKVITKASNNTKDKQFHSAVVYGGILYDLTVADMNEAASKYKHSGHENNLLAIRSEDERGRWNYLQGTKTESENIYKLLCSNNVKATLLQDAAANEESFKSMNGISPSIIHLSTHGFFLDTKEKVEKNPFMSKVGNYSDKEDNLIRTGVLMAGANNVWCGKTKVSGIEDGILTADEISRLDLSGTDLVVLSACETAKGKVDEIDGVLGLQSGLKKAGVKSIVMSLWKVPDHATSILMTSFYEQLSQGKEARIALQEARKHLMNQNEAYKNPYYWAAFVVLD